MILLSSEFTSFTTLNKDLKVVYIDYILVVLQIKDNDYYTKLVSALSEEAKQMLIGSLAKADELQNEQLK